MAALRSRWSAALDQQHRYPTGPLGQVIGERMVRQNAPETRWTVDLLAIQPADTILELGCGAGRGLALAAAQSAQGTAVGLDLSATMIRAAGWRNRRAVAAGRVALLRANLEALPLAAGTFDKIFSIHTFYFWPEPLAVFAELISLLKPGGVLAVTLSTGQTTADGQRAYGPLHDRVQHEIVPALRQLAVRQVEFREGPDSRQYNNVAIVVRT